MQSYKKCYRVNKEDIVWDILYKKSCPKPHGHFVELDLIIQ